MRKVICIIFCIMSLSSLFAQNKNSMDSLVSKIKSYGKQNRPSALFTCFDKTVYVNNENVWFTAYLLNYSNLKYEPTILSAIFINDQTGSIVLEQKFEMANGLSFGHAVIPDSIPPGDYTFITYTNILANGIPKDAFIQPITIKTASETPFFASLNLIDSTKTSTDNNEQIGLSVETKDHLPIKGATVTWDVGVLNNKISSGLVKTDAEGKYLFSIARNQIESGRNFLNVQVTYKNEVRNVKLLLPIKDKKLQVGFYPESGSLIDGLENTIGLETKSAYGRPLSVYGVLYQNNHAIDTIHTDSYGMGRFKLAPRSGSKYELKVIGYPQDVSYALPRALSNGIVISTKRAISDDSLLVRLVSKDPGKFFVMVHNFGQVFYSFPVQVTAAGKKLLVNLADLPKGLSAITILDSLQRPCAERIFFAHYNRRSPLNITTDRAEYSKRQKVRLKLKLSAQSDSIKGIVTVACVQSQKIESKKFNDIESYHYLKQELEALPVREAYMGQSAGDKDYLEKVLLIKGWRKYRWQDLARDNINDSIVDEKQVLISGSVTRFGKPLKKPVALVLMTDSATKIIKTDAKGDFQLNNSNAVIAERRKLHLMLSGGADDTYAIKMKDSFNMLNSALINGFKAVNYTLTPVPSISSDSSTIKGLDHVISLKEVKITGKKEDTYNFLQIRIRLGQKNECGDYVCMYNILNCPNHPNETGNHPPVDGNSYLDESGRLVVYNGCTAIVKGPGVAVVNGLNYSKEFYGADYSVFNPPEPEYQSTIYWKHACFIDSKEIELDFYTSDITGRFSIIVQGVSSNGLIYEKKEFMVNKK